MSAFVQSQKFPKSARLLKKSDFFFRPYSRYQSERFKIIYSKLNEDKPGRIGISISKKVLKKAVSRNRVRRLIKETFRLKSEKFHGFDVHLIGDKKLFEDKENVQRKDIEQELDLFLEKALNKWPGLLAELFIPFLGLGERAVFNPPVLSILVKHFRIMAS